MNINIILTLYYINMNIILPTEAKPSNEPTNKLPTAKVKFLLLLCNRNKINFCVCNEALYH